MIDHYALVARDGIEAQSTEPHQFNRLRLAAAFAVSMLAMRISIGLIYVWFGALKIAGESPAEEVVHGATPWPDPVWFVPALGWFEVAVGALFVGGLAPRVVGVVFVGHVAGTGSVLVFSPAAAFRDGNPVMLTMVGEFVVKNAVLFAAGIVVVLWELCRRQVAAAPDRRTSEERSARRFLTNRLIRK